MARSRVSRVIEAFLACSTASRRRGLLAGSAPDLAAMVSSVASLVKRRPFCAALCSRLFCFHCAPMARVYHEVPGLTRFAHAAPIPRGSSAAAVGAHPGAKPDNLHSGMPNQSIYDSVFDLVG